MPMCVLENRMGGTIADEMLVGIHGLPDVLTPCDEVPPSKPRYH